MTTLENFNMQLCFIKDIGVTKRLAQPMSNVLKEKKPVLFDAYAPLYRHSNNNK